MSCSDSPASAPQSNSYVARTRHRKRLTAYNHVVIREIGQGGDQDQGKSLGKDAVWADVGHEAPSTVVSDRRRKTAVRKTKKHEELTMDLSRAHAACAPENKVH